MKIRLYFDEDTYEELAASARRAGYDCLTTKEARRRGSPDLDQLAFSAQEGRTILTFNKADYAALHKYYAEHSLHHCGIILLPQTDFKRVNRALLELLSLAEAEDMIDQIEYLSNWM